MNGHARGSRRAAARLSAAQRLRPRARRTSGIRQRMAMHAAALGEARAALGLSEQQLAQQVERVTAARAALRRALGASEAAERLRASLTDEADRRRARRAERGAEERWRAPKRS